jgi:tyrosine-protein phosphatase
MRAAFLRSPWVPQQVWDLKGMHAAYAYVKQKSPCVGPNMSSVQPHPSQFPAISFPVLG